MTVVGNAAFRLIAKLRVKIIAVSKKSAKTPNGYFSLSHSVRIFLPVHYVRCQRIVTTASVELTNLNVVYCMVMIRIMLIANVILGLIRKDKEEQVAVIMLLQTLTCHVILGTFDIGQHSPTTY